ncbi:hypothetical protein [Streptomyces sp. NPDC050428]|uniref:hypothetical protein n=1 Tax=Streptomyces sp. NPDC050428 TaxID=3155757 RepID=UPI0034406D20
MTATTAVAKMMASTAAVAAPTDKAADRRALQERLDHVVATGGTSTGSSPRCSTGVCCRITCWTR